MRMSEMKAAWTALALCLLALPACAQQQGSSQQTGDPVADAARKAREEKKNAVKPKKVYTDDDVKPALPDKPAIQNATAATASVAGQAGAAGAPGAAAASSAQKPGDSKENGDPNSEKAWRKRFADQRAKIEKAEQELDVLQRELDKSQVQYYNDPQKALNEQNNRQEINDKTAKIEAKKKEIEELRQGVDDLEAQLRKAGGDPGWAR